MPRRWSGLKRVGHHHWFLLTVIATAAVGAVGQQPSDAESALRRTRERVLTDLERMPRYTCVQTVTRRYYRPQSEGASCAALITGHNKRPAGKLRLRGWDRLRLEVAIVNGTPVYSWVGAPRFESSMIEQLAGLGPFNTGDFGPFLHLAFTHAAPAFKEERLAGGQRLLAYSYDVPVERSAYQVKNGDGWIPTAYSGELLLDPIAADVVSLTVRTAELPESNPDCQAISAVEYGRTQIHDRMVLIPRQTTLVTIERDGSESESLVSYASCREYASKTRMLLDGSSSSASAAESSTLPAPAPLPGGLHFHGRIVTTIDSDTAAAGDPIEAVLRSPIRDKNKLELAPTGARLHGRLLGMEQRSGSLYFRVSIQFESIELQGRTVPLRAAPDPSVNVGGVTAFRPQAGLPGRAGPADKNAFIFFEQHLHLEKFDWNWTTLPYPGNEKQNDVAK
jgi:hypothetical protein